jgi:hypothetical protein
LYSVDGSATVYEKLYTTSKEESEKIVIGKPSLLLT